MKKWTLLFHTLQLGWCVWLASVMISWYTSNKSLLNLSGVAISLMLLLYWVWCVYRTLRPKKPVVVKELNYITKQDENDKWWVGHEDDIATYGPFDQRSDAFEFIINDITKETKP